MTHRATLGLLAEFRLLVDGAEVVLPHSVERVVAFLALVRGPVTRARLAGSLWPDVPDHRAHGDLRSALWRLRRITVAITEADSRLALAPEIDVDVHNLTQLTKSLIDEPPNPGPQSLENLVQGVEILPDWDEEWLIVERERYRLLRLRALDRCAEALVTSGNHAAALDAALACIDAEPYRETTHRLVVQIHMSEGNISEALRAYERYRSLIANDLGISPSPIMQQLVEPLWSTSGPARLVDSRVTGGR